MLHHPRAAILLLVAVGLSGLALARLGLAQGSPLKEQ
jgi:hypothetical protein